jgi:hypothetical protein
MNIPIAINIITKNNIILKTLTGTDLNNCLNKIIIELKPHFDMKVDYPLDYDEFISIYCIYIKNNIDNIFDYKIYNDNEWIKPWEEQEIYEKIVELINTQDIQDFIINPITYNDECD